MGGTLSSWAGEVKGWEWGKKRWRTGMGGGGVGRQRQGSQVLSESYPGFSLAPDIHHF